MAGQTRVDAAWRALMKSATQPRTQRSEGMGSGKTGFGGQTSGGSGGSAVGLAMLTEVLVVGSAALTEMVRLWTAALWAAMMLMTDVHFMLDLVSDLIILIG